MPPSTSETQRPPAGDTELATGLFQQAYDELRRIAADLMLRERNDHNLGATALVNEAFVRIFDSNSRQPCGDNQRLRRMAMRAMRNILIDHARRKGAAKRSAIRQYVPLETIGCSNSDADQIQTLEVFDKLVDVLEQQDPQAAEFARLRVYAGQSVLGAGRELSLSRWDSYQTWEFIEAWFKANSDRV
ncbi:ECF-type sigma factor [Planctomycetaceae bacterium SH139]